MFRKTLLATTALVLGASVAFASTHGTPSAKIHPKHQFGVAGHVVNGVAVNFAIGNKGHAVVHNTPHAIPGGIFSNLSKDANAEFVSWYGYTAVNSGFSDYFSSHSFIRFDEQGANAVGFSGGGKLTSATVAGFAGSSTAEFDLAILSNSGGLPGGTLYTSGTTTFSDNALCCSSARTVSFGGKHKLPNGNYFASLQCANDPCYGGWAMENTDFSGATTDYWHVTETETYRFPSYTTTQYYNYSSPWHASTYYPTAGAVSIK